MDPRNADEYPPDVVQASMSILVELYTVLGAYRDALVLLGGWAPHFLLERHQTAERFEHVGSIDIDVAVDPTIVEPHTYTRIIDLLKARGYTHRADRKGDPISFSFERRKPGGETFLSHVDSLAPPQPEREGHRTAQLQPGFRAIMSEGCEAVFDHHFRHEITAPLPGDGEVTVEIPIADLVGILATKGYVLGERYKEKDAYDIYAVVANYKTGPWDAAATVRPHAEDPLVRKGLDRIQEAFASRNANGPAWVADFLGAQGETREQTLTDAYMNVREFLEHL